MPISIGDCLLKLGVDTRDMDKGLQGLGDRIKQHQKAIGLGMVAAGGTILAAGALSVKTFAEMGDAVQKMAIRTGFSTETLSELRYAAEISGTSLEGLDKAVKRMSGTILDAQDGMETYIRAFEHIGIKVEELDGLNPEQQFLKIALAIAEVEDPMRRAALAQDFFGRSGTELLPMLADGATGLDKLREAAHKFAPIFDQEAANAAANFNDRLKDLTGSVDKVKFEIADKLIPILIPLIEKIRDIISGISAWMKEHPGLTKVITLGSMALGILLTGLGSLLLLMPGLTAALGAFGISLHLALGPIALITLAVAGLIAAGIALWKNWDKVRFFFMELWENMKIIFGEAVKFLVNTVLQPFMLYIKYWIGNIIKSVGMLVSLFNREWGQAILNVADKLKNLDQTMLKWADTVIASGEAGKAHIATLKEVSAATSEATQETVGLDEATTGYTESLLETEPALASLAQNFDTATVATSRLSAGMSAIQQAYHNLLSVVGVGGGAEGLLQWQRAAYPSEAAWRQAMRDAGYYWTGTGWMPSAGGGGGGGPGYSPATQALAEAYGGYYQHGGIAMRPQLAHLAEKEPEVILPVSKLGRFFGRGLVNIFIELDGRVLARALGQPLVDEIRLKTGVLI